MQSLRPEVNRLRTAVDKGTSNREQYVHKFCTQLDKDIAELDKEAKEIKNEAQVYTYICSSKKEQLRVCSGVQVFSFPVLSLPIFSVLCTP